MNSLSMIFATPVVVLDWPDSNRFNTELVELVLAREHEAADRNTIHSNVGGWQSPGNLITWREPCIDVFRHRIEKSVTGLLQHLVRDKSINRSFKLLIDAWANVNRNCDYDVAHTHPNCATEDGTKSKTPFP